MKQILRKSCWKHGGYQGIDCPHCLAEEKRPKLLKHSPHASEATNKILRMVDLGERANRLSNDELCEVVQRGFMDHIDMTGALFAVLDEMCQRLEVEKEEPKTTCQRCDCESPDSNPAGISNDCPIHN